MMFNVPYMRGHLAYLESAYPKRFTPTGFDTYYAVTIRFSETFCRIGMNLHAPGLDGVVIIGNRTWSENKFEPAYNFYLSFFRTQREAVEYYEKLDSTCRSGLLKAVTE